LKESQLHTTFKAGNNNTPEVCAAPAAKVYRIGAPFCPELTSQKFPLTVNSKAKVGILDNGKSQVSQLH